MDDVCKINGYEARKVGEHLSQEVCRYVLAVDQSETLQAVALRKGSEEVVLEVCPLIEEVEATNEAAVCECEVRPAQERGHLVDSAVFRERGLVPKELDGAFAPRPRDLKTVKEVLW